MVASHSWTVTHNNTLLSQMPAKLEVQPKTTMLRLQRVATLFRCGAKPHGPWVKGCWPVSWTIFYPLAQYSWVLSSGSSSLP